MKRITKDTSITITFKTPNGNIWEEIHSGLMVDIFKKNPTVDEIRDKESDKLIYKKEGK